MPRKFLRRYLPTAAEIRANRSLRFLGEVLHEPNLWHLNRRSVSVAAAIGGFCAYIPFPIQMTCAALLSLLLRCNIALALTVTWVTNPFTFAPMFFFSYRLGAWILDWPRLDQHMEFSFAWVVDQIAHIWQPLLLGSLLCGSMLGALFYVLVRLSWRLHVVRRWRRRRARNLTPGVTQRQG